MRPSVFVVSGVIAVFTTLGVQAGNHFKAGRAQTASESEIPEEPVKNGELLKETLALAFGICLFVSALVTFYCFYQGHCPCHRRRPTVSVYERMMEPQPIHPDFPDGSV